MEYQEAVQKAIDDVRVAESNLLAAGFPGEHWTGIKAYLQAVNFTVSTKRILRHYTKRWITEPKKGFHEATYGNQRTVS
jgi:hypothetical protein